MSDKPPSLDPHQVWERIAGEILAFLSRIPGTGENQSDRPSDRARSLAAAAAAKAGLAAGALALPPGPLGWFTIIPELVTIWKIQSQMVADIAGAFGKKPRVTREQMLYCLFRHTAAQAVRDLVVRAGERFLVRQVSGRVMQEIAAKIGIRVTQRSIWKGLARWIPLAGAVGVGAYAYYDTGQVAKTAIALFGKEIDVEVEVIPIPPETRENPPED